MDQILIMNDGTRMYPAYAILASGVLYVYIENGMTLDDVYQLLTDPEKTAVITSNEFGIEKTYEGYTDLFCIRREDSGQVNAGLKRGTD